MPLRDHFHPPVSAKHAWEELHSGWPMMIVRQFFDILPKGFVATPGVHLGKPFQVDVSAYEEDEPSGTGPQTGAEDGGVAVAAPPQPTLTLETDLSEQDEFEVRVYDTEHERQLVAAIEIVSPANKDRPDTRRAFVAKVAALLQKDVCVSIIDLVTIRHFNMYADLLELIGGTDPQLSKAPPDLYSVTIRSRKPANKKARLDMWYYPMVVGQLLPALPIWLTTDLQVLLPLEAGYEETCRLLHIS